MTPTPTQAAIAIAAAYFGVNARDIASKVRTSQVCIARKAVSYALVTVYGYSLSAVARELGVHHTSVMHAMRTIEPKLAAPVAERLADYQRNRMADPMGTRSGGDAPAILTRPQEPIPVVRGVPHRLLRAVQAVDDSVSSGDSGVGGDSVALDGTGLDQPGAGSGGADGDRQRGVDPSCEWIQPTRPRTGRGGLIGILRGHGVKI